MPTKIVTPDNNIGGLIRCLIVDIENVNYLQWPVDGEISDYVHLNNVFDFAVFQSELEVGSFDEEEINENGSDSYLSKVTLVFKKDDLAKHRLILKYKNRRVLVLVLDQNNVWRIIGRPEEGAKLMQPVRTTGAAPSDRNYRTIEIFTQARYPAPIYTYGT